MKYLLRFYDVGSLISFCAMMTCILLEIVLRNIFKMPTPWAEEASRLFFIWSVFLGSASAWYRGTHIVIQVLVSRLKGRVKSSFKIVVDVLTTIFLIVVWVGTISIMFSSYHQDAHALGISISYFYLGLFLGVTGIIIFHFNFMVHTIRNFGAHAEEA